VLRVLAARGQRIPVETITRSQDSFWIECPGDTDARSPIVFNRRRCKKFTTGEDYVAEVRVSLERIRYARRGLGCTAKRRHLGGADDPFLICEIERVPETSV